MKTSFISVGINEFDNFPNASLNGCVKDAINTGEYFKNMCDEVRIVLDEETTEEGVKDALMHFKGGDKWSDNFIGQICFSSHGSHVKSQTEKDGFDEITVCRDFDGINGGILDDWWNSFLSGIPDSSRVYLLADTCMSTGLTRSLRIHNKYILNPLINNGNKIKGGLLIGAKRKAVDASDDYPGILIPGCRENGTSSDTPNGGALTCAFLDIIKNNKDITNHKLVLDINNKLRQGGFAQKSTLQCKESLVEDLYYFCRTNK